MTGFQILVLFGGDLGLVGPFYLGLGEVKDTDRTGK